MTGAQWFNAGTVAVVILAAAGLVRLHVQELFAARRAATVERSARSPRLASPTLPRPGDRATFERGQR